MPMHPYLYRAVNRTRENRVIQSRLFRAEEYCFSIYFVGCHSFVCLTLCRHAGAPDQGYLSGATNR